jgi:hypothetical protein
MKRTIVLDEQQTAYAVRYGQVDDMTELLSELMRDGVTQELLVLQAKSILKAHAVGRERWALTARDGVACNLTVGKIWGVAIWPGRLDMMASADQLDWDKVERRQDRGLLEVWGPYAAVKRDEVWSMRFTYTPAREFTRTFALVAAAHESAIRPAALSGLNPESKKAHHPGLVVALERATGITLPQPSYILPQALAGEAAQSVKASAPPTVVQPRSASEVPGHDIFDEGRVVERLVNARERDRKARAAAIARYGARCILCGFDFGAIYGPEAASLIHVHHLQPIAKGRRETNPATDLVPLCANCHMVVHSRDPMLDLDVVRAMLGDRARRD